MVSTSSGLVPIDAFSLQKIFPPENTCAHQPLNWPYTLVSLELFILFHVSAVHVCTFPSIKVYSLLREHVLFHIFQEKNESRGRVVFKKNTKLWMQNSLLSSRREWIGIHRTKLLSIIEHEGHWGRCPGKLPSRRTVKINVKCSSRSRNLQGSCRCQDMLIAVIQDSAVMLSTGSRNRLCERAGWCPYFCL